LGGQQWTSGAGPGGGWPRHPFNEFHYAHQSPDGNKVVFASKRQTGGTGPINKYVIEVIDFDPGSINNASVNISDPGNITVSSLPMYELYPKWNPAGTKIAFTSTRSSTNATGPDQNGANRWLGVYVADMNQANPVACNSPTLVAGGQWDAEAGNLSWIDPDTSIRQIYGHDGSGDCLGGVQWSPDGTKLVFGMFNVCTVDLVGGDVQNLTAQYPHLHGTGTWVSKNGGIISPNNRRTGEGVFSPDGKHILFTSKMWNENRELWIMKADGSDEPVQLDPGNFIGETDSYLSWDSDDKIRGLFRSRGNDYSIYTAGKEFSIFTKNTATFDKTKTMSPKYKYWVMRVPVSFPEYA
jgi:Tol biopolymer transport system component